MSAAREPTVRTTGGKHAAGGRRNQHGDKVRGTGEPAVRATGGRHSASERSNERDTGGDRWAGGRSDEPNRLQRWTAPEEDAAGGERLERRHPPRRQPVGDVPGDLRQWRGTEAPDRDVATADDTAQPEATDATVTGAIYGVLLVIGFVVGIYGAFYHSLSVGSVPAGAIVAVVATFAMCRVAGRALRARLSALVPAAGWLAAVVVLSSQRPEGDLVITNSRPGHILLFGGSFAAAIAVTISLMNDPRGSRERGRPRHG